MKITFISVGHVKKPCIKEGLEEYLKRIKRYSKAETVEIKEEHPPSADKRAEALKKEGQRILKRLRKEDLNIVLSDKGREFTSEGFAGIIDKIASGAGAPRKGIALIIGGPYGLDKEVCEAADMKLSLSRMTLPHDMARLVIAEQVYRAFTIIRGEPYSH